MGVVLGMALGAFGNRGKGAKGVPGWEGILLLTLACIIANPGLVLWTPLVVLLLILFRNPETGETWLAATEGRNIWAAVGRSALILPLVLLAHLVTGSSLYVGLFFPIIAGFYWAAGKVWPKKCGEIGELLTGAYLVACVGNW